MVSDFEPLIPLKEIIEKNGFKNEYYKNRFEVNSQFDKK